MHNFFLPPFTYPTFSQIHFIPAVNLTHNFTSLFYFCVLEVCISVQRCVFLLKPFSARQWRRRYDLLISIIVWVVVSLGCSPFILMRSSNSNPSVSAQSDRISDMASPLDATSTPLPLSYTMLYSPPLSSTSAGLRSVLSPTPSKDSCFKDLPMRRLSISLAITMMALAELFGFLIPLVCICYSSARIAQSLIQRETQQNSQALDSSAQRQHQSVSSTFQTDRQQERQTNTEKRRALQMVLGCSTLFLLCFAPYHLNFLLYLMVSQKMMSSCVTQLAVRQFHPVSLCLASLSCCLNPLLYYFLTAEFRLHLTRRTSSFTASLLSSPISSPTQRLAPHRLMSMESSCSDRE